MDAPGQDTSGGTAIGGNVDAGGDVTGRDQTRARATANPQQNMRSGDTYIGESHNTPWITTQILDHGAQIRELAYRLPIMHLTNVERVPIRTDNPERRTAAHVAHPVREDGRFTDDNLAFVGCH